jgi:sulfofructose kinase
MSGINSGENKSIDVFGLGQSCWDLIGQIDSYPPPDSKYEMSSLMEVGGGPVATALVALSRWGLSCAFNGLAGDDIYGKKLTDSLDLENIDTSRTLVRSQSSSQVAFIVTEKYRGRRTIFWQRPNGLPIEPKELDLNAIRNARLFYTDGLFIEASVKAAQVARKAGVPVVVDAGTLRKDSLDLVPHSDYYIVSRPFAQSLMGQDNPREACLALQKLGPQTVGVTLGEDGYVIRTNKEWIEGSAYSVETIDTTGCGDVFHAGITFGILRKWDMIKTLDFAAWVAAEVSTKLGGRDGIPDVSAYERNVK